MGDRNATTVSRARWNLGWRQLSWPDFTVCDELGVVIAGVAFAHRIYQFALAHSGWRHATSIPTDCVTISFN